VAERIVSGREFQILGSVTRKARAAVVQVDVPAWGSIVNPLTAYLLAIVCQNEDKL